VVLCVDTIAYDRHNREMTTIALGMEVETHNGERGTVVASPRDGKGWLVSLDRPQPIDRRFREELLREWQSEWDDPYSDYNRM